MIKMFVFGIPILLQDRHLTTGSFTPLPFNQKEITDHASESVGAYSNSRHEKALNGQDKIKKKYYDSVWCLTFCSGHPLQWQFRQQVVTTGTVYHSDINMLWRRRWENSSLVFNHLAVDRDHFDFLQVWQHSLQQLLCLHGIFEAFLKNLFFP